MSPIDQFFIFGAVYAFIISILAVLWFWWKSDRAVRVTMLYFGVILLPLSYVVGAVARLIYPNPRPYISDGVVPLIHHDSYAGFPSDHTLFTATLAALVAPFSPRLSLWLWCLSVFIGLSRVYVGVHHFVDVIGAIVIVVMVAWLIWKSGISQKWAKKYTK